VLLGTAILVAVGILMLGRSKRAAVAAVAPIVDAAAPPAPSGLPAECKQLFAERRARPDSDEARKNVEDNEQVFAGILERATRPEVRVHLQHQCESGLQALSAAASETN
jgi:hypothetical protein